MSHNTRIDEYISLLPDWQKAICTELRQLVHQAAPDIIETIKFTDRPYFTLDGNVCALLATKDHVNVFLYDPIAPDPQGIINQGQANATARAIQIYQDQSLDTTAFIELIKAIVANNRAGGWRKLQKARA